MTRACQNCAFFHPEVTNSQSSYPGSWAGECRAAGPQMEMKYDTVERYRIWPVVDRTDWCGLFQSAQATRR